LQETDYANQSWPEKLPKAWDSYITVEFQRTYGPKERPTPSQSPGIVSSSTRLPIVPGGEGNPDNELYEASASVEIANTSDLEALPNGDNGDKSLDGRRLVQWTIPFRLKSNVTQQRAFELIFNVKLTNKKTGQSKTTSYHLAPASIKVHWIPGTKPQAYGLFGTLFPFSFAMIIFPAIKVQFGALAGLGQKKGQLASTGESVIEEENVLHANLWLEDKDKRPIPPPLSLEWGSEYRLLFAIEPELREFLSSSQLFIEPPELQKSRSTDVEIQVMSRLLRTKLGCETRKVAYYSGRGFAPEAFDIAPVAEGWYSITVRLFYRETIIYREKIEVEVKGATRAARA